MKFREYLKEKDWLKQSSSNTFKEKEYTGKINVNEILKEIVKPNRAINDVLVWVNTDKFDKAWSKDKDMYIGKDGTNGITNRYQTYINFLRMPKNERIKKFKGGDTKSGYIAASEVFVREDGMVSFTNGRHRFAVYRDLRAKKIPVAMDKDSVERAKKFGYI